MKTSLCVVQSTTKPPDNWAVAPMIGIQPQTANHSTGAGAFIPPSPVPGQATQRIKLELSGQLL